MKMIFLSWVRRTGERRSDPFNDLSDTGISRRQQYSKYHLHFLVNQKMLEQADIFSSQILSDKPLSMPRNFAAHPDLLIVFGS